MNANIDQQEITLRLATRHDADMIFAWRNALATRQYFFDPRPLNKAEHLSWLENSLTMTTRYLLIAEKDNQPIGVLRYDLKNSRAEIDIYLCPELTGQGLGTKILLSGTAWIKRTCPALKILSANVIVDNIASVRAFEKAGFHLKIKTFEKELE